MQFCFIANGDVLTLPITPASYEWTTGKNIETVNISQLGDVYLPGNRSRHSGMLACGERLFMGLSDRASCSQRCWRKAGNLRSSTAVLISIRACVRWSAAFATRSAAR